MMGSIIWLASYPKSGNTWFRVFLTNLRGEEDVPAQINKLNSTPIASARDIFDDAVGIESSDLTMDEIDRLRPEIYEHIAANADETLFMKVHDAYTYVDKNTPLFPKKATLGAIYFIRNPLDVAVSFAHHSDWDYDTAISRMADERYAFYGRPSRLDNQLRQRLLSWSGHVLSWVDESGLPVCVLRYEDMKQRPAETFGRAVMFSGLEYTKEQIARALDLSSFEELQRQEKESGFREKSPSSDLFFRKGEVGSWRGELTEKQARQIVNDHREVMRRFGYLGTNDEAVF
jgi:aryl sulfotransferase